MSDIVKQKAQAIHDINSSISALMGAMEVMKDEWQCNPELIERILPLALDKLNQLNGQLEKFKSNHS